MVHGERAVRDTLARFASLVRDIVFCEGCEIPSGLDGLDQLAKRPAALSLAKPLFDELDLFGTRFPILVLTAPRIPEIDLASKPPEGLEVLCALSDPSNVGALLRSAAAFGVSRVVLLRESASPFHPRAVRAASAATLVIHLARGPSITELEPARHGPIVALDMRGEHLVDFRWPKNARLLVGEEGQGIPKEKDFVRITIPISDAIESLNATVAAAIALNAYRSQQSR